MLLATPAALAALFLIPSFVYRGAGVHGLQVKLQRHRVPANGKQVLHDTGIQRRSETFQTFDFMDVIYSADFTIGQQSFRFVLDTGSSDLWLNHTGFASTDPSLGFNFGSLRTNVTLPYGIGVVAGAAVFAPLTLGDYTIPSQVLVDVHQSKNMSLIFDNGMSGLMGLSFSGPGASGIQHTLTAADSSLEFSSQTVLSNVFASDPSGRSFIAFDLGRDLPDGTPGDSTFSINEVPNAYLEA
ncbi:acid protease, partial [Exidia glandulosa HHB12029]